MKLNLNFWMGRGVQTKEPSVGEVWIYSGNIFSGVSLVDILITMIGCSLNGKH